MQYSIYFRAARNNVEVPNRLWFGTCVSCLYRQTSTIFVKAEIWYRLLTLPIRILCRRWKQMVHDSMWNSNLSSYDWNRYMVVFGWRTIDVSFDSIILAQFHSHNWSSGLFSSIIRSRDEQRIHGVLFVRQQGDCDVLCNHLWSLWNHIGHNIYRFLSKSLRSTSLD